uniref:Uncharacterized protein n=1 Tax=uncultured marine group II/III euryarchaeote KM3_71_G06 TaxID=1456495 RepID=A0A075HKJ7_9EURY|nr:hypothetical protein [uncultured marine group II/III euryarchaeote KM3_71_G06]
MPASFLDVQYHAACDSPSTPPVIEYLGTGNQMNTFKQEVRAFHTGSPDNRCYSFREYLHGLVPVFDNPRASRLERGTMQSRQLVCVELRPQCLADGVCRSALTETQGSRSTRRERGLAHPAASGDDEKPGLAHLQPSTLDRLDLKVFIEAVDPEFAAVA